MAICPICVGGEFSPVATIDFGGWCVADGGAIHRESMDFELGRCRSCGHVMITTPYTDEIFSRIYLETQQDPVFWDESLVGSPTPYEDMVDFVGLDPAGDAGLVVDFGCGPGVLLGVLHERRGIPVDRLLGIDFNRRLPDGYPFLRADLNRLDADLPDGIAVAFASHLLEHLVDPRHFLRRVGSRMAVDGLLYIEVPDADAIDEPAAASTNLVNQQHIHYFTESALVRLAESCGFEVVRRDRSMLGCMPRLRIVLKRRNDTAAAGAVARTLAMLAARRARLGQAVREALEANGAVGLWGIGADFQRLVTADRELRTLIGEGRVRLFDLGLAGRVYEGQTLLPPSAIAEFDAPVFMVPMLGDTRLKMHRFLRRSAIPEGRVIDPYAAPAGAVSPR